MTHTTMAHRTSTLERTYGASPARVFRAWEDPEVRRIWGSPSDEVQIRNEAADFRVGGEDVQVCMVGDEAVARVVGRYLDIVPEARIVYSEAISEGDTLLGVSQVSAEFIAAGSGTRLVLTLQTVAVDGSDLLDGVAEGWTSALDRLGRQFVSA
jgi:uncharacterized protein YndB with AHSA1/START domain